jgi:hypothetical protein
MKQQRYKVELSSTSLFQSTESKSPISATHINISEHQHPITENSPIPHPMKKQA